MFRFTRSLFVSVVILSTACSSLLAQEKSSGSPDPSSQRKVIESVIGTVTSLLQNSLLNETSAGEQMRSMIDQIEAITAESKPSVPFSLFPIPLAARNDRYTYTELERLESLLHDLYVTVIELRAEHDDGDDDLTRQLRPVEDKLEEALSLVREFTRDDSWAADERDDDDRWRRDPNKDDNWWDDVKRRRRSIDRNLGAGAFVGDFSHRWPYVENELNRTIPSIRYNRVEGFVLGIASRPLEWDDFERGRIVGQIGYAFALDAWRYEVGAETRLGNRRSDYALKFGAGYTRNTKTNDTWKTNWVENSLAAFFFENDFFDYYQVEGWTVYAVQRLTPFAQLSAGFRSEEHSSLGKNTSWSLFDGTGFRDNPMVDEGRINSFVFALEGGQVFGFHSFPRGAAFRTELEVAGAGGDYTYTRYVADGRLYVPVSHYGSFGIRLRGGTTSGDEVPFQRGFTMGGIGSVRGYPQNIFYGTHMLLGNAEYVAGNVALFDDFLDDILFFGFADVGWTSTTGFDAFDFDDVIPSAGFGIGFDDRAVRLELAWPLRDMGTGMDPTLWLRISPAF